MGFSIETIKHRFHNADARRRAELWMMYPRLRRWFDAQENAWGNTLRETCRQMPKEISPFSYLRSPRATSVPGKSTLKNGCIEWLVWLI